MKKMNIEHILYFTPSVDYAALYAPPFKHEGKWSQVVFQCRVNLKHIKGKVPATGGAERIFRDPHFKNSEIEWLVATLFLSVILCDF